MVGLVPTIHASPTACNDKTWMAGSTPGHDGIAEAGLLFRAGDHASVVPDAQADALAILLDEDVGIEHCLFPLQLAQDQSRSRHIFVHQPRDASDRLGNIGVSEEADGDLPFFPM